jgi:hypothetical protein
MKYEKNMNKRIRELAEHAHEYALEVYDQRIATEGQGNVLFYQIRDDKYAELIVKECMSNLYLNGYDDAMIQIQKHFGVEE